MNLEALKLALKDVLERVMLTPECEEQTKVFLQEGDLTIFSDRSAKELSLLYKNIILPSYQFYSDQEYIPNIFARLELDD